MQSPSNLNLNNFLLFPDINFLTSLSQITKQTKHKEESPRNGIEIKVIVSFQFISNRRVELKFRKISRKTVFLPSIVFARSSEKRHCCTFVHIPFATIKPPSPIPILFDIDRFLRVYFYLLLFALGSDSHVVLTPTLP